MAITFEPRVRLHLKGPLDTCIASTITTYEIVGAMDIVDILELPRSQYWSVRYRLDRLVRKGVLQVQITRRQRFYSFNPEVGV